MPNVNFGMPTDYGAEQADIERRRKYAEMLSQQSMEPLQSTTAGGYVVPINPLQGLAKMLQAYSGRRGQEMATEQGKDLAARRSQALAEALGGMPRARTEDLNPVAKDDEGNQMPGAYKTTYPSMPDYAQWQAKLAPLGADAVAMGGNFIGMQQRAQEADETRQFRAQQSDEARQARLHEIQLRLQDQRTTAAERAALLQQQQTERLEFQRAQAEVQRQFQDQMARQAAIERENLARITSGMAAANRNPVAVMGPNGPVYVPPNQAIGMTPASMDMGLQGGLAGAKAGGKTQGESQANAQIDLPRVVANANNALNLVDQMIGSEDGKTKEHPGFQSAVGMRFPGLGLIPGTDTANFNKLLDQVKGGAFLEAFNSLKGGGQITEIEGKKATDAITRMSAAQSEAEFKKAAREYQSVIRGGLQRAQQKTGPQRRASDQPGAVLRFDSQGNPI